MAADDEYLDKINRLPDELILHVFKMLSLEALLQCERVCSRWRKLVTDSSIWKNIVIIYSGKTGQTEINEKNYEILSSYCDYIYCVKLQYVSNYSFIKQILEKCSNLISIELVMCRINVDFPKDLEKWQCLKKLNLKNSLLLKSSDNNIEALIKFDNFVNLQYLSLSDFGLSPINFRTLINCVHLSHIFIEKIKDLNLEDVKELILAKQSNLISLHLYGGSAIDNECLELLSKCTKLKDLAIIRCEILTDKGILPLSRLQRIEKLQLWNNVNFTELGLLTTLSSPKLMKLKSLSFSRIKNMSPVLVDVISEHYKDLKFLALYQCPRIINTDYEKQLKSKFRNIEVVLY